ncbi:MAG: serine/threonine protein phosphatase [Peptococcaceae bacterium BRH_c4b]|nr:MAG: serine/threonine protein phosphatase [Peptococcaceae bacterium BRH_c4b]
MKLAVISDIHSNLYGLEAVLKDIGEKGVTDIFCTGDLVGYGPRPNEVIDLIRKLNIPTVMGNYDDAIGNLRLMCGCDYKDERSLQLAEKSLLWTKDNTSETNKQWLRELSEEIRIIFSGMEILFVHGSPRALNEYLYEDTPENYIKDLLDEVGADILVCGHTHLSYIKKTSAGYIVNAGSAGKPKHGNPNVTYLVLEVAGGELIGQIVEVPYNYEDAAKEIEQVGLPREFAEIIRTGRT